MKKKITGWWKYFLKTLADIFWLGTWQKTKKIVYA